MRIKYKILKLLFLLLIITPKPQTLSMLYAQDFFVKGNNYPFFVVKTGYLDNGQITQEWLQAIRSLRRNQDIQENLFGKKQPNREEAYWIKLIKNRFKVWPTTIDSLGIPFSGINHRT